MASHSSPDFAAADFRQVDAADRADAPLAAALQEHEQLKHQMAAQSQFIQLLTHQLATPLTALSGSVCLLEEADLTAAQRQEFLDIVQQQVHRLQHLLDDIVALRNAEVDELDPRPGCFGLPDLVVEVSQGFAPHALDLYLDSDLPPVLGDRWQISQVLVNLISNAVKYSPPATRVQVGAALLSDHWLEVWVQDEGLGIPAADQPRLFEPFFRVRHGDRQDIHGTGLGLSLCKLLVEKQGGTLSFTSVHGEGSRFYFTVPTVSVPSTVRDETLKN
jgi:signal transduction histidine kinase